MEFELKMESILKNSLIELETESILKNSLIELQSESILKNSLILVKFSKDYGKLIGTAV